MTLKKTASCLPHPPPPGRELSRSGHRPYLNDLVAVAGAVTIDKGLFRPLARWQVLAVDEEDVRARQHGAQGGQELFPVGHREIESGQAALDAIGKVIAQNRSRRQEVKGTHEPSQQREGDPPVGSDGTTIVVDRTRCLV
jgi:hypothetical protein